MRMNRSMAFWTMMCGCSLNALATTRYVDLNSSNPVAPYLTWATAATNINDAIGAAASGDEVRVTDGLFQVGGRFAGGITNRVAVDKPIQLTSVNGPLVTIIQGSFDPVTTNGEAAVRGVYLTNGASLAGFTVTNGATWGRTYCPARAAAASFAKRRM